MKKRLCRHARSAPVVFLAVVALLCWLPSSASWAAPTITYVQGNYATPQTPQGTVKVTFSAAQAAGDLNVVVVGWNDSTATVSAVTDSSDNTYGRAVGPTVQSGIASQSIYYAKNIASAPAGANTVTVTFSSAANYPDIRILEYNGADPSNPVDVTAASSGNSATSSSGSVTTTNAMDLIFGANLVQSTTTGPGSSFTKRLLTSPDGDIAEDWMVTATGSYSATAPVTPSNPWIMQMAAFRTAASSGGSFTLSASPIWLSVAQGDQGTSTITTTVSGFSSAISLSASGAPSGTTVSFNPSTIAAPGAGSSTMTIAVGSSTAVGTYAITVTGNGGGAQHSATVNLTVSATAAFTLSASPTSVSVAEGNQGTSTITTTVSGGFNSAIGLSASGMPSGTTVSFNPSTIAAPGAGSSAMTIAVGSITATGTYAITVTGNGGGMQQSATITLTVAAISTTIGYVQGDYSTPQTPQSAVSVTFNAAQAAGDMNVVAVGWNDTTATVTSVTDQSGNTYALAVGPTLVTGTLSQSIYYARNIAPAAAGANAVKVNFSAAAVYPDIRILEYSGADPSNPVDVTAAGSGSGTTSSSGAATTTNPTDLILGANIVTSFTSGPGSGFTQRLLTSPDGDVAEDEMVTTVGSHTATAPLSSGAWIMQMVAFRTPSSVSGGFTLSASPASLNITQGNQGTSIVTITVSGGFNSSIGLTASGAPSGTTVSFDPSTIPAPGAGTSTMTLKVGSSTQAGTYPITVAGNGRGVQGSVVVNLIVTTPIGTQTLSLSPTSLSFGNITIGDYSQLPVHVQNTGTGGVTISSTSVTGAGYTISDLSLPQTLNAGQSTSFTVTFTPTSLGPSNGTASLISNATTSPNVESLSATGVYNHYVNLTWAASTSSGVLGYNVYRGTVSGGPYSKITGSPVSGTSYTDSSVSAGQTYYYVATTVTAGGESGYSNQTTANVPSP